MTEINLIKIDGKPLEKLIDVISKGIGTIYRPRAIKKEAEAKAYEIELIERAKSKALAEGREIDADSYDKIQTRLLHKETQRQENIDNVTQIAAQQISQETEVSDEPVDSDWSKRFFNIVEDVSNEEMQNLWGRILAGEVKRPKSYSLRTLELLKNLSKEEAQIFSKVAKFCIYTNPYYFIQATNNNKGLLYEKHKISFDDILLLEEIGLINTSQELSLTLSETKDAPRTDIFWCGNAGLAMIKEKECPSQTIQGHFLSKTGIELLSLIDLDYDEEYIVSFAKSIKHSKTIMKYGKKKIENGIVSLSNVKDVIID